MSTTDRSCAQGRLSAIEAVVKSAGAAEPALAALLPKVLPELDRPAEEVAQTLSRVFGAPQPSGLGGGGVAVWGEHALFAVSSSRPPSVSVDGEEMPMSAVRAQQGTAAHFASPSTATGQLDSTLDTEC